MPSGSFLDKLTTEQRAAATYLDGPLRIIAGAGTGKAGTIAGRNCVLVQQEIYPAGILTSTVPNRAVCTATDQDRRDELCTDVHGNPRS